MAELANSALIDAEGRADCGRVLVSALAEYHHIVAAASAEYKCGRAAALAEYHRILAALSVEDERVQAGARAKYGSVRDTAWADACTATRKRAAAVNFAVAS